MTTSTPAAPEAEAPATVTPQAHALDMTEILKAARQHVHDAPLPAHANENHAATTLVANDNAGKHAKALGHATEPMTAAMAMQNAAIMYARAAACFAGLANDIMRDTSKAAQR